MRCFSRMPPSPFPLGDAAEQAEFKQAVRAQEQANESKEALEEADAVRREKLEYQGWEGDVNPSTGEVCVCLCASKGC